MRRPSSAGFGILLVALLGGCTLESTPDSDSVGRLARASAGLPTGAPTLAPKKAGAPTVEIFAPVEAEYDKKAITLRAGVVNISFTTTGNHNLSLVGPGYPDPLLWGEASGGQEDHLTYSVKLAPGVYTFYCSVQGHRQAGMEGTLRAR